MPEVPVALIVLLVVGGLLLWTAYFTIYRERAWKNIKPMQIACVFFGAGSLAFWFSVFPLEFAPAEGSSILPIGLAIAAALFTPALAILLHQFHKGQLTQSSGLLLIAMFTGFGFFRWSDFEKEHSGADQHVGSHLAWVVATLGIWTATVVLVSIVGVWVYLRLHRLNRMARHIGAGRHTEAIRLGEAVPAHRRHPLISANLMNAYSAIGQHDKAIALAEMIAPEKRDHFIVVTLAGVYHAAGRHAEALALIEQVQPQNTCPQQMKSYVEKLRSDIHSAVESAAASG